VQRSVATAQWQSRNFQETDERGDVIGKQLEVLVLDGGPLAIATDADGKHVVVLWPPVTDGGSRSLDGWAKRFADTGEAQAAAVQLRQAGLDLENWHGDDDDAGRITVASKQDQDTAAPIVRSPYDVLEQQRALNRSDTPPEARIEDLSDGAGSPRRRTRLAPGRAQARGRAAVNGRFAEHCGSRVPAPGSAVHWRARRSSATAHTSEVVRAPPLRTITVTRRS